MVDLLVCTLQDGRYGEGDLKKKKDKGAILVIKYNNENKITNKEPSPPSDLIGVLKEAKQVISPKLQELASCSRGFSGGRSEYPSLILPPQRKRKSSLNLS